MGHRYYTKDDIQLFRCIKKLKDEGMLLKDLKPIIPELRETRLRLQNSAEAKTETIKESAETLPENSADTKPDIAESTIQEDSPDSDDPSLQKGVGTAECFEEPDTTPEPADKQTQDKQDKPVLQSEAASEDTSIELSIPPADVIPITQLEQVRSLIGDVLTEVVTANNEELKKEISQTVTKDVMREMDFLFQAKERQEEEHFRKLDCLIRQQQASRKEAARETPLGKLKKLLT
ncbi:MAG: MerR family transcriptional regulator [Muricomes sp.]